MQGKTTYFDFSSNALTVVRQPELVFCGRLMEKTGWIDARHSHQGECEIALILRGSGVSRIDGSSHPFHEGDLLIYEYDREHQEDWSGSADDPEMFYMVIRDFYINEMQDAHILPRDVSPVLAAADTAPTLRLLAEQLLAECDRRDLGYEVMTQSLMQAFFILTVRLVNREFQRIRSNEARRLTSDICAYIEQNYAQRLTLQDIAAHFFISKSSLEQAFRKSTGQSPIHYLIEVRMKHARRILRTSKHPVVTVAALVGYDSVSFFCQTFKATTGLTPTQYREQNQSVL